MLKSDCVTKQRLLNPYIEIGPGFDPGTFSCLHINVLTFKSASEFLLPLSSEPEARNADKAYSVYAVVDQTPYRGSGGYLEEHYASLSRTLMGFLLEDPLKENLPRLHGFLNR